MILYSTQPSFPADKIPTDSAPAFQPAPPAFFSKVSHVIVVFTKFFQTTSYPTPIVLSPVLPVASVTTTL